MYLNKARIVCFIFLICNSTSFAQTYDDKIIDSLSQLTYEDLQNVLFKEKDSVKIHLYARAYTKKGQVENDTTEIAEGYFFQTVYGKNKIKLLDTVIYLSNKINDYGMLTIAHYDRAIHYFSEKNYKMALHDYIQADKFNKGQAKDYFQFLIDDGLATLKSDIDHDDEALILLKKSLKYALKNNIKDDEPLRYFNLLALLSHSFRKNKLLDSAYYYNMKGLVEAKQMNRDYDYNHFVLNGGLISFFQGKYLKTIDSINKSLTILLREQDLPNLAVAHFYLGKAKLSIKKKEEAIPHFKKVDSIFIIKKDLLPELNETYPILRNYYKEKNDVANELKYLENQILLDSILNTNYRLLTKKFANSYDNKNLIEERAQLKQTITQNTKNYRLIIVVASSVLLGLLILFLYTKQQHKKNKHRLELLLKKDKDSKTTTSEKTKTSISINPDVVSTLLKQLEVFETQNKFIDTSITLNTLAKQFNTNPKYLSKTVNFYKEKNFSSYLSDLRIQYAINKLKEDTLFRKYTIKAIANEVGFNSAESFSKAFVTITKLKPSYFLKELNKVNPE